jgi:hypothetical protein
MVTYSYQLDLEMGIIKFLGGMESLWVLFLSMWKLGGRRYEIRGMRELIWKTALLRCQVHGQRTYLLDMCMREEKFHGMTPHR